jgi:hypothetical protein
MGVVLSTVVLDASKSPVALLSFDVAVEIIWQWSYLLLVTDTMMIWLASCRFNSIAMM